MQQHWSGYLNAVAGHKTPNTTMPTAAPYETSSNEKGATGFMDLLVKQPQIQARYIFKTESMPINQKNYGKK